MKPEDIAALRRAEDPMVSPDGLAVAFTVTDPDPASNRYQHRIWIGSTRDGAKAPRPFTGGGFESLPRWSPDGTQLAFVSRREEGPSEICTIPVGSGGERAVVCSWEAAVTALAWSPDGRELAFVARDPDKDQYGLSGARHEEREMPPRRVRRLLYRANGVGWTLDRPNRIFVTAADGSVPPRALTKGPFRVDGLAWSPDGERLAFASARHESWDLDLAVDLWTVGIDGEAEPERLTDDGSAYSAPSWSPDGRWLGYLRNPTPLESPRHRQVGLLELSSREHRDLTTVLDLNCAPLGGERSPVWVGDGLLFGAESHGQVHLYLAPTAQGAEPQLVVGGDRWVSGWDWAAGTLAFVVGAPTLLPELTVAAQPAVESGLRPQPPGPERQLTDFSRGLKQRLGLVEPERFVARSADGTEVECWAMAPAGCLPGDRRPTLLNVHGGPFTQYGSHLFDEFQIQASAGFGVLYCNPRGSSGYSEEWGRAIRWPECAHDPGSGWGTVDFEDVMACVDEGARRFAWVDPECLGIIGGSYGGYMTSWAIGHSTRFKAACSERACNNLLTMEYSSDIAGFVRAYVGRDHLQDPAAYLRHSPVSYIQAMTTPLLILHSEQDLRCPINQAEELFVGLRLLGRNPEMVRFPSESHELTRSGSPRHRVMRAQLIIDWFREQLDA